MSTPTSKAEFKEYVLRKLGKPVIEINVDDDQVDDRIDEAIRYYWDYHFDGSEKVYYKHLITAEEAANRYITLPENIIGAVRVFPLSQPITGGDMFNIRYQIALNDLYTLTSQSMIPYYMTMTHLQFLEQLLVGEHPIRYNRMSNKLYVDTDLSLQVGQYLVVEAYSVVDPAVYTDAWSDRWLLRYATALVKEQWGNNLKKFDGMKLPGGLTFNGQKIYEEAHQEKIELEHEMVYTYSLPASDMIG